MGGVLPWQRGAGFPLLGKSSTEPPAGPNMRIDFQFDSAAFDFYKLPFKIPYPVPFRLVGDEGKVRPAFRRQSTAAVIRQSSASLRCCCSMRHIPPLPRRAKGSPQSH